MYVCSAERKAEISFFVLNIATFLNRFDFTLSGSFEPLLTQELPAFEISNECFTLSKSFANE